MGRKRANDVGLPQHWSKRHGAYFYRVPAKFKHLFSKGWVRLADNLPDAYRAFSELPVHDEQSSKKIKTMNDLADFYELEVYPKNSAMTRQNKIGYMKSIKAAVGGKLVKDIKKMHARQMHKALIPLRGSKTAKECVGLMRHMLTVAEEEGIIDRNPLLGLRIESNPPRRRHVTHEELAQFIGTCAGPFLKGYLMLKSLTGMDRQMMLALRREDVREDGIHTRRNKNQAKPKVYVWDEEGRLRAAIDQITNYNKKLGVPSMYLFHTRKGQPYLPLEGGKMFDSRGRAFGKPNGFASIWQRRMAKWVAAGNERFTEHDIRKTPASATTTEHAQQLLDHSSPGITARIYQVGEKVVKIQGNSND